MLSDDSSIYTYANSRGLCRMEMIGIQPLRGVVKMEFNVFL